MGLLQPHERHRRRNGQLPLIAPASADWEQDYPGPDEAPDPLQGPFLRVFGSRDIARIATVARALHRSAVVVSDGAVGWHLFAAMIHAAEADDAPLTFLFDAADSAGAAVEALRAGAGLVLCEANPAQCESLAVLAEVTGATLLDRMPAEVLECADVEALKAALNGSAARRQDGGEGRPL